MFTLWNLHLTLYEDTGNLKPMTNKTKGFTLIELLVVIAALGILLAILMPTITSGILFAKRTQAASNMRQIVGAWAQYAHDNEGELCSADNGHRNGRPPWVYRPAGTTRDAREDAIRKGALFPYLRSFDVFTDPNHIFPTYVNSYAINGMLNGGGAGWAQVPYIYEARHYSRINGGTVMLIPEHDWRNYNVNSFVMDPRRYIWNDRVAGNYNGGDNLAFVDGHVEYRIWKDPDTLRDQDRFGFGDNGSVDIDYMETIWYPVSLP